MYISGVYRYGGVLFLGVILPAIYSMIFFQKHTPARIQEAFHKMPTGISAGVEPIHRRQAHMDPGSLLVVQLGKECMLQITQMTGYWVETPCSETGYWVETPQKTGYWVENPPPRSFLGRL